MSDRIYNIDQPFCQLSIFCRTRFARVERAHDQKRRLPSLMYNDICIVARARAGTAHLAGGLTIEGYIVDKWSGGESRLNGKDTQEC